ncbi:ralBP1-associated Eps domain-containing protein 1 isoform X3 [Octopus bimaculoides]|uniref:ralBP1-associated Eps domain-containing protein 1 isoform X3 n=1 Tax=Octopus bimaculoides TaxID=37653 RepID=UPI00071E4D0D|nr:ralBP1-associated Eps domain-containing protein 1 isoform X3 [Octopus bimaculoides]|eukprot:XP_014784615.1 PREDICTED: ralBP1-associated Eps domain-containing protein 1-like isoform X5 [Octopus bimaculoides]
MEGLKLCEQEQRYYGELFQNCDVEGSGRVTGSKALDLFRLSGLNQEVLQQISELCGAKRLGHFGRSQFYIALKLIAAVQCGLPAKLDSLNLAMEVSLPKFHRANGHEKWKNQASPTISSNVISGESDATPIQDGVCPVNTSSGNQVTSSRTTSQPALSQPTGQLPPPPATKKSHIRNLSGQYRSLTDNPSQYSQLDQKNFFLKNRKNAPRRPTSLGYPLKSRDESPLDSKSPPFSPKQSPPTSPTNRVKLGNIGKQQTAPASVNTSMTTSGTNVAANAGCVGQVTPVATVYPAMPSQFVSPATTTPVTNTTGNVVPGTVGSGSGLPGLVTAAVAPSPSAYTNSVHDVSGWASFEDEESKGLLDTGANKMSWENIESQGVDSSSISSENESIDDVWTISKEQREYYLKQFKTMQPEENGVIIGSIAKEFFEKSKLPVHELSKIWQLSDLNRDGALSLDEFCIAMHLVVLRRNEIELPDHLPVSLMPYSTLTNGKNEPFAADLPPGSTLKRLTPTTPPSNQWTRTTFPVESPTSSGLSSPAPKPVNFEFSKPVATDPDSKIIHPVALRMSPDGHPIPPEITDRNNWTAAGTATGVYHLNPYLKRYWATFGMYRASKSFQGIQQLTVAGPGHLQPPPAPCTGGGDQMTNTGSSDKGPAGTTASISVTATTTTTVQQTVTPDSPATTGGQFGPPRLPPRPIQSHGRSISVDLKMKGDVGTSVLLPPPAVPPRTSPKDVSRQSRDILLGFGGMQSEKIFRFTDFSSQDLDSVDHSEDSTSVTPAIKLQAPMVEKHRRCASLDIRQIGGLPPITTQTDTDNVDSSIVNNTSVSKVLPEPEEEVMSSDRQKSSYYGRQPSRDKRELQMAISTHKERNAMLERVNSELNQELQEVMEQRIALEIQLEHLRPYHS